MNTDLTNRVTMFKTTRDYLEQHNSIWNGMPPFAAAILKINTQISSIDATAQQHETPTGAAADKASARDALEDVLFLTSEALSVLAHNGQDQDLLALTDLTPATLDRMTEEALANRAANVLAQATDRKTDLGTLQVSQANLDELNEALQNFNTSKTAPRMATAQRVVQTASLPLLVRDTSATFRNQIDPMVNLFRRSHPDLSPAIAPRV